MSLCSCMNGMRSMVRLVSRLSIQELRQLATHPPLCIYVYIHIRISLWKLYRHIYTHMHAYAHLTKLHISVYQSIIELTGLCCAWRSLALNPFRGPRCLAGARECSEGVAEIHRALSQWQVPLKGCAILRIHERWRPTDTSDSELPMSLVTLRLSTF